MDLPPLIQAFVLHFGEMGGRWGVSRTVGQIYALLFLAPEPLCAEEISEALGVSRSNVSISLRELQSWGLVSIRSRPGERRDFFAAPEDIWDIVKILAAEKKKREVDPTLATLRDLTARAPQSPWESRAQARMEEMRRLIEMMSAWHDDVKGLEPERLALLLALGSKIAKLAEAAGAVAPLERFRTKRKPARARAAQSAAGRSPSDSVEAGGGRPGNTRRGA